MKLTIEEIARAVHGSCSGELGDCEATGVTWDSRDVEPGDLYVALPGERVDGHDFAGAAIEAGAVAVLAMRELPDLDVPVIKVSDTETALADLARHWRTLLTGTVIGLTGSSGKTTTKNLVRDVLAHDMSVVATKANQNNDLGVPRTILEAERDTQVVVVEMGMRGRGQIASLAEVAQPEWGLITNVGTSHIELLGSRDEIAHAKAELFETLPESRGLAFVNALDDYAVELCDYARLEQRGIVEIFFGGEAPSVDGIVFAPACVWPTDIVLDEQSRPTFTINAVGFEQIGMPEANGEVRCELNLHGMHNVTNACAAVAVGLTCGMTLEACREALEAARPEKGRQQVHRTAGGIVVIDDAYNANPDSMAASLDSFASMQVAGKRVAVLGDMLELGDFARSSHEEIGSLVARSHIDELICVGALSRYMAHAAIDAGMGSDAVVTCEDAAEAYERVRALLSSGDAVLVKASHSIGLDAVVEGLVS